MFDKVDLQLWIQNQNGQLIDKVGNLPFKEKVFNLPDSSSPNFIEDINSSDILTVRDEEVVFQPKVTRKRKTRSINASSQTNFHKWIKGPPDSNGFFKIIHSASGKVLTSSEDGLKIEELKGPSNKSQLIKVKKTFVWCPKMGGFVSYVSNQRNYQNQDLQVDLSLDSGGGNFKILTSIQPNNNHLDMVRNNLYSRNSRKHASKYCTYKISLF